MEDRLAESEDGRKELEAVLAEKKQALADAEAKLAGDVLGRAKELEASERRLKAQLEELQLRLDEVRAPCFPLVTRCPPLMSDGHCTQAERSSEDLAKQRTKLTGDLAAVTLQLDNERRANADHEKAVRRVCGLPARVIGPCRRTCRAYIGGGGNTRTAGG
jgi:septal ring factor EnvC (AmiA/AmiB activator)